MSSTPIPEPHRILNRTLACPEPDCPRTFKPRELARYALHWRLAHGSAGEAMQEAQASVKHAVEHAPTALARHEPSMRELADHLEARSC